MTPYYQDDAVTIYLGDCREILPGLEPVDLVLTDPPYGIADIWSGGSERHGWTKANNEGFLRNQWDVKISNDLLYAVTRIGRKAIVWGGNYYDLPASRGWLIWNKPERGFSLAEAELAWTNIDMVVRVFDGHRSDNGREHPTQKPLALMKWCLERVSTAKTVLDPFMGSGTTLRAAKDLGRKAIGIEIEEKYCEIAAKRMSQEVLNFNGMECANPRQEKS
jgi:site-specific DNA-methyltransferase (adenine-specific)